MNMPGFHHTRIHLGVAELSKSLLEERISDPDDFFKETSIIRVACEGMNNNPLNLAQWHLLAAFLDMLAMKEYYTLRPRFRPAAISCLSHTSFPTCNAYPRQPLPDLRGHDDKRLGDGRGWGATYGSA